MVAVESPGEGLGATFTVCLPRAPLARPHPDIAALPRDIGMPEMDGYTLMRQIRQLPREQGGQIPAIALTAYAGEVNQTQALAAGFQRHLAKPLTPETIVAIMTELLASTSA
ncbi:MAG: response regulator [Leptolyngbyaceae cyanobacterium bins.349]|nr:response regulator [Leptolyngbyaceae cyanobacterium bins.349]